MRKDDGIRLRHMLDATGEIISFSKGKTRVDLERERMLVLSVLKLIEIIGEASTKISAELKQKHPSVPWAAIIGMRNRLIHGYFDVDLDRVWDTINVDIPNLINLLNPILHAED